VRFNRISARHIVSALARTLGYRNKCVPIIWLPLQRNAKWKPLALSERRWITSACQLARGKRVVQGGGASFLRGGGLGGLEVCLSWNHEILAATFISLLRGAGGWQQSNVKRPETLLRQGLPFEHRFGLAKREAQSTASLGQSVAVT